MTKILNPGLNAWFTLVGGLTETKGLEISVLRSLLSL